MVWQPEIDELQRRRAFAEQMGGEAGVAAQRQRGKLTVRERIDLLCDAGSFQEIGQLAGAATYEGNELKHVRPSNMVIRGSGERPHPRLAGRLGDHRSHLASRRHPTGEPRRRILAAAHGARGGLQFLRFAPRQPRGDDARRVRHPHSQRNDARARRRLHAAHSHRPRALDLRCGHALLRGRADCEAALRCAGHVEANRERMRYPEFRAMGLPVGSGVVESACGAVVADRLKRGGMRWTVAGANAMLALRCWILDRRLHDFQPAAARSPPLAAAA